MNFNTVDEMKDSVDRIVSTFQVLDARGNSLLLPILDINKYRELLQ